MHAGKSYTFKELIFWTRRSIYWLIIVGTIPTVLYAVFGIKWIALPWTVVALLGTATAFIVGFRNSQTYSRTWEARQIWGAILNGSRAWGTMCRDFIHDSTTTQQLVYRHFAWLTALRYQMREQRAWETMNEAYNVEYQSRVFTVPEKETPLDKELAKYLSEEELAYILTTKNKAAQLLSLQSKTLKQLLDNQKIDNLLFVEMQRALKDFFDQQGRSERIKNFPYPRQFATINKVLVKLFCIMLPFSMLKEFDKLNDSLTGIFHGHMVWFTIPFSVLLSWVFTSLDQVGQSTENPFEGSSNDVPISQMSRTIEIDLREMLGETHLPPALQPKNNIIL
ncbi:MAG: bestrophin family ion channel [Spirosomataceae bacterium]